VDLDTARTRLEGLRAELESSAETLQGEHAGEDTELSVVDQHPADSATNLSDADRQTAVLEALQVQLDEVNAALARIDAGTYGKCIDCGNPLPDERLDARPEAARCVTCQARQEGAR
jgi:DnaK suppressor protein